MEGYCEGAPLPGLRRLRVAKGLSVAALAKATGISESSLRNAERSRTKARSGVLLSTAVTLATHFGVTVDELLHPVGAGDALQVAQKKAAALMLSYQPRPVMSKQAQA